MKNNYWILLCLLVMVSCATPKPLKYEGYHNFQIQSLGFKSSQVTFNLDLYNPNNFGLKVKNTDLNLFVNDRLLGHTYTDSLFRIKRRSKITVPMTVDLDMNNMYKNAWSALTGSKLNIRIDGKMKAGKSVLFLNIPVSYKTERRLKLF